jgi:hypothetical protein
VNPKLKAFLFFILFFVPCGLVISLLIQIYDDKQKGLTIRESVLKTWQETLRKFKKDEQ